MNRRYKFLIFTLLLFCAYPTFAQTAEDLEGKYNEAKYYYNEGKIDSATYILEGVLSSPAFSKLYQGIKADVYKLLSMSYITLDRLNDAEAPLRKMLALRPFYRAAEDDLMRLKTALDTLRATPRFSIGIRSGVNMSFARRVGEPISVISSFANPNLGEEKYRYGLGFYFGFFIKYRVLKNLSVIFIPSFTNYTFGYSEDYTLKREKNDDAFSSTFGYSYSQTIRYLETPISLSYGIKISGKIRPFVSAGWFQGFLLSADKQSEASYITGGQRFPNKENFIATNRGYMLGAGINYELNNFAINIDARYRHGVANLTNISNRFVSHEIALGFYDIPNDIQVNNIEVGFTLIYHLRFKVF